MVTVILFSIPFCCVVSAGEQTDAEENLWVVGDVPEVKIGEDTTIKLHFEDYTGFNYTRWWSSLLGRILLHVIWPITIGYCQGGKEGLEEFKNAACLHSIEFDAYVEDNITGWHAIVEPSLITGSTEGNKANLTLKVRIDGPTVYPMANVIIKVTRKGANGAILGISYHKISLKAEHIYLLDIKPLKSVVEIFPGSSFSVPVEITNRGNYIETYRISVDGDGVASLFGSQLLTINPGETIKTNIQIHTPFSLFDLGTARKVEIKAYPLSSPENVFTAGISVVTRGTSLQFIPVLILIIILLVLLVRLLVQVVRIYSEPGEKRSKNLVSSFRETFGRIFSSRKIGAEKHKVMRSEEKVKEKDLQPSSDNLSDASPSKPRNLKKLMSKIKREEMKQKRKFEKL
ncbi:MAG: hypothetical protein FE042_00870 [Thermoplasmata archaeon]|nr:MAG: hypothetical protein FE042_00870 [Thermoplasmata archaeon]